MLTRIASLLEKIRSWVDLRDDFHSLKRPDNSNLTLPLALEDGRVPGLISKSIYVLAGLFLLGLVWACVGQIRELTVANGTIIPSGNVKLMHHLEGGVVEEVLVENGQLVEAGTRILRLRPTAARSDLRKMELREANLQLQLIRLNALVREEPPEFGTLSESYPLQASAQKSLFDSQIAVQNKERYTLQSQIETAEANVRTIEFQAQSLTRRAELQYDQVSSLAGLYAKRLTTRKLYTVAQSEHAAAQAELLAVKARLSDARGKLVEAHYKLEEWKAQNHNTIHEEQSKLTADLVELRQLIVKQQDLVKRLVIHAPARGIIQHLASTAPGEVIRPGGLVAQLVPVDVSLAAEVELDPRDIGHVRVGSSAQLKISTFDPNTYGLVSGTIKRISPTTFQPETGQPHYKVLLSLDRNYVGLRGHKHFLAPGMEVEASILTGSRSLMVYLLKPVNQSLSQAFSER